MGRREKLRGKEIYGNNPSPSSLYHSLLLLGAYRSFDDLYFCLVVGQVVGQALGCYDNQGSLRNRQDT